MRMPFRMFVARLGGADETGVRHAQGGEQGARWQPELVGNEKHHRLCAFGQARPGQVGMGCEQRLAINFPTGRDG